MADTRSTARDLGSKAESAGRDVQASAAYQRLVSLGLIAFGVVHLLIGWIALQVAFGGSSDQADKAGALEQLASAPFGVVLLWIVAVGLLALVVWQLLEAVFGHRDEDGATKARRKATSVVKAVVYGALAVTAAGMALRGGGGGGGGGQTEESFTARLLSAPAGQVLVVVAALAVVGLGGYNVYKGISKKFVERDLSGVSSGGGVTLGQIGYSTKGVVYVIIGILLAAAAVTHDAEKSGGLDDALKALRDQPFGSVLLAVVALGLACFGLYCFFWSRHPKHS